MLEKIDFLTRKNYLSIELTKLQKDNQVRRPILEWQDPSTWKKFSKSSLSDGEDSTRKA